MKRLISLLLAGLIALSIAGCSRASASYAEEYSIQGYTYDSRSLLEQKMQESEEAMNAAHDMALAARNLGYPETHQVIRLAKDEYRMYSQEYHRYKSIYNTLNTRWEEKRVEYPEATMIWEFLKQAGYSNYICAGIVGNIMTEVGGNTLDIKPLLQTVEYYGFCQWSTYYPDVWGLSVEDQCNFLLDTIQQEFRDFGSLYKRRMTYEEFLIMTDCEDIALCFAKVYERCNSRSYRARQDNAVIAYNYFVS